MPILQSEVSSSILDLNPYFRDSDLLPCSSFSQMSNLIVRDLNSFLFSTLYFSFALGVSNLFVRDLDPLALSPKSSLLH